MESNSIKTEVVKVASRDGIHYYILIQEYPHFKCPKINNRLADQIADDILANIDESDGTVYLHLDVTQTHKELYQAVKSKVILLALNRINNLAKLEFSDQLSYGV